MAGSASDLRALNEDEAPGEEQGNRVGGRLNDETVSESIITCGSSAYHAECESLATRGDDNDCRRRRKLPAGKREAANSQNIAADDETDGNDRLDLLFVGHQYGDKPLLADDELDTYDEAGAKSPSLSVKQTLWKNSPGEEVWEKNGKDSLVDVFALAPFQKPTAGSSRRSSSRRKISQSRSQPTSQTVSPMDILTGRKSSLLLNSTSPITPPQDAPLVDFGEEVAVPSDPEPETEEATRRR